MGDTNVSNFAPTFVCNTFSYSLSVSVAYTLYLFCNATGSAFCMTSKYVTLKCGLPLCPILLQPCVNSLIMAAKLSGHATPVA